MIVTQFESTARALVPSGKGILAADESHPSIEKRFSALGIENTVENRRVYRQMFFTTPGASEFISGVILFDETIGRRPTTARPSGNSSLSENDPGDQGRRGRRPWPAPRAS
jgi:fructose-bisphosphate aldolase class I